MPNLYQNPAYDNKSRMNPSQLQNHFDACYELNSRWYAARPIYCELSPVTDFREACCRLNSGEGCVRGGFCNFIHRKEPSPDLEKDLELATKKWLRERGRDERSVSRSPTPPPMHARE